MTKVTKFMNKHSKIIKSYLCVLFIAIIAFFLIIDSANAYSGFIRDDGYTFEIVTVPIYGEPVNSGYRVYNTDTGSLCGSGTAQFSVGITRDMSSYWHVLSDCIEGSWEIRLYNDYPTMSVVIGTYYLEATSQYVWDSEWAYISWDENQYYEYADGIKNFRIEWHEWNDTGGHNWGLGVWITNDLQTYDSLQLIVQSPAINDTWDLSGVTSGNIQDPSITVNSEDYVEWFETGDVQLEFYLYVDTMSDAGTFLTLTLDEVGVSTTKEEYEEYWQDYEFTVTYEDDVYGLGSPLQKWRSKFLEKFPISWVYGFYDAWTDARDDMLLWETATDQLSVAWTMPSGLSASAFDSMTVGIINMAEVKSTYPTFISSVRTIFIYIVYISLMFAIYYKTKRFIFSLKE